MAESEENKPTIPPEKPAKDAAAEKSADAKPFESAGKKIHNEITYRGIDWLANSTIGVTFAYWSARTKNGQKYFGEPVSNFFKKILAPVLKKEAHIVEGSKWGTMFAGIMAGGFTIIPPMMVMENKKIKKSIVRTLDNMIYGKDKVDADPKFEESYKQIDEEPRKGFVHGMISRFIAIAPLITVASIPATNKPLIKYIYDPIGKFSKWGASKLGIKPSAEMLDPLKGALEHIEGDPNIPKQMQSNWDFLHRTIGFDFGLTVFYSILHEASYKTLAAMGMRKKKEREHTNGSSVHTEKSLLSALMPVEIHPKPAIKAMSAGFAAKMLTSDSPRRPKPALAGGYQGKVVFDKEQSSTHQTVL